MKKEDLMTPCFILEEANFVCNLRDFKKKINKHFDKNILGYSFKTNSLPRILELVREQGFFAEVVSDDEYNLARKIGFGYDQIIYNGPVKNKELFFIAAEKGSIINIDSQRELEWLEISEKKIERIGIRVNFDLENRLPGHTSTGSLGGRFGFCYENGELHKAIGKLKNIGIKIAGLHMHVSNASKSPLVYKELASMASSIIEEEKLNLDYIDFGGGYFGGGDNGEAYEQYIIEIKNELRKKHLEKLQIILEPGASVIATPVSYYTKVVDIKDTTYGRFVIIDGSRLDVDSFMVKNNYNKIIDAKKTNSYSKQVVCGYTCMEKDRLFTLENETELEIGDSIELKISGSYTMCFNNLFISYLPTVYSFVNDEFVLVRKKWEVNEFVQGNRWLI